MLKNPFQYQCRVLSHGKNNLVIIKNDIMFFILRITLTPFIHACFNITKTVECFLHVVKVFKFKFLTHYQNRVAKIIT